MAEAIQGVIPEAWRQLLGLPVIKKHVVTILGLVGGPRLRCRRFHILLRLP